MKLELFNTTDRVKVVPGYRYAGKVVLLPKKAQGIEDYMVSFYRPYARTGVIIRAVEEDESPAPEVVEEVKVPEVVEETPEVVEAPEVEEVTTEEVVETVVEDDPAEEAPAEEVAEEGTVEEPVKVYTKGELMGLSYDKIKAIAEELGVELTGSRKKAAIVDAIIKSQK